MYSVKQNSDVIIKHNFAKQQFYSKSTEFRSDGDRDHHGGREGRDHGDQDHGDQDHGDQDREDRDHHEDHREDRDHHEEVGEDDREDREEEEEEPYL